jgi:ABC-type lipoprotein release transport system permease subunit
VAIPLAGMAVAVAAALIPARWAARTNVVEALHAE